MKIEKGYESAMLVGLPIYSWFSGGESGLRVSLYPDGSVELQEGRASFRAPISRWMEAARIVNGLSEKTMICYLCRVPWVDGHACQSTPD
jgi:hypothetical protein